MALNAASALNVDMEYRVKEVRLEYWNRCWVFSC